MFRQRGVTLIEVLLVAAVAAAILMSATRLYKIVDDSHKVASAANMILVVYQAAAQWHDALPLNADLIDEFSQRGYLLSDFKSPSANPWGGAIKVDSPDGNSLHVQLTNIPSKLCNNLSDKFKNMQNATSTDCIVSDKPTNFDVTFNMTMYEVQKTKSKN